MRWRRGTGVVSCKRTATPDRSILSSSSIACTRLISRLALRLVREVAGPSGAHMTRERRRLSSSHDSSYIDPTVPNTCSLLLRARYRLLTLRQLPGVIVVPAMAVLEGAEVGGDDFGCPPLGPSVGHPGGEVGQIRAIRPPGVRRHRILEISDQVVAERPPQRPKLDFDR